MHRHQQARARRWATIVGIAGLATFSLLGVALRDGAHGAQFPASAEAILLLDGTQTSPPDGFNMQIDDNGFTTAGGAQTFTHMFCVQSVLHYRCGIGANDLIRVQGTPVDAQLSQAQANQVAWILTHRAGYDNQETQLAIWCITNPGVNAPFGNSDALCAAAKSSAVPAAPTLTLTPLGSAQVSEGASVHFSLSTNAPTVNLSVSDGGANATLCGTNPANAAATLNGAVLQQTIPATQRTFELCLTRANVASGSVAASLTATLDATAANLQTWVHPTAPTKCQGLVDTGVSASRISASAQGTWANVDGSLTVTKSVYGNAPTNSIFSVTVTGPGGYAASHDFPDATGAPWSHTFIDLPAGEYTVIETATGGATHVSVSPSATTVVTADSDTAVTVTNAFVGTLTLTKQTDIPTGKTFGFDINCAFNGTNVNGWTNPIKLTAGRSYTTPEIPAGALCSVTESDTGNPISTLIELDSLGVQSQTVGTQASGLGITNGADTKVGFFNSFAQGSTIATSTTTAIAPSTTSIAATSTTLGNTIGSLGSTPPSIDDDNNLATTGSDADQLFTIGGAAILGGGALIFGTRRRRKTRADS